MDPPGREKVFDNYVRNILVFFIPAFIGLGVTLSNLPEFTQPPQGYTFDDRTCITGTLKTALILTHIFTFVLIPIAMKVFYTTLTAMRRPKNAIFASQLGLAFIMVSIGCEIGWHVTQCWYYENNLNMLNFMFYFFLLSAFALWSDGLVENSTGITQGINIFFGLLLFVVCVSYPNGNKTPIYIALTVIFAVLTYRGYLFLDKDLNILWFPFFSVVVNLVFIGLLFHKGGDQYVSPAIVNNAKYHILHDLLGTLLGVAIFTYLVYRKGVQANSVYEQTPLVSA